MYVTVNTNRKSYMGNPNVSIDLTSSALESSIPRSLISQIIIFQRGVELGHILLLNTNRNLYMGNPATLSDLTMSDTGRSSIIITQ